MCKPITSLLFSTAVLSTLSLVLASSPDRFSALAVTNALRDRVSNGEIEITDVPKIPLPSADPNAGVLVSEVSYTKVKQLLSELHESVAGVFSLADFTPTSTKDAATGARYYEYVKRTSVSNTMPTPSQSFAKPPVPSVAPKISTPANTQSGEAAKILSYVQNKLSVGQSPTLKQIQSRLKDTPLRCKDIADILISLGAGITTHPTTFYRSSVTSMNQSPAKVSSALTIKQSSPTGLYPYAALSALVTPRP